MQYIAQRYGNPLAAKAFWEKNRWYADGGHVRPTYYDGGGILPPGLTLAMNATGKPETIRTFEQERTIQHKLSGRGDTYHIQMLPEPDGEKLVRWLDEKQRRERGLRRALAHAGG